MSLLSIPGLEGKTIDLDMTPQEAMCEHIGRNEDYDQLQQRIASFDDVAFPFVDVWESQARLAFMVFDHKGNASNVVRLTEEQQAALGITEEMIHDAVCENGALISGYYQISEAIRAKLAEILNAPAEEQLA